MQRHIERLAAETVKQVAALNADLDPGQIDTSEQELETALSDAASRLVEAKMSMKEELRAQCEAIIARIMQLQAVMPDVAGPSMSELEPPFRPLLARLNAQTEQFQEIARVRTAQRNAAAASIAESCAAMDLELPVLSDSLAEKDISALSAQAAALNAQLQQREAEARAMQTEIRDMEGFLNDLPASFPADTCTNSGLALLAQLKAEIGVRYDARRAELSRIEAQVVQVAELLELPAALSESGTADHRMRAAEQRLAELNELKRKSMAQVVARARVKIAEAWAELCVDRQHQTAVPAMRSEAVPEGSEVVSNDRLEAALHALEAERLFLQALKDDPQRQRIVEQLREYAALRQQEIELAEASRDPKRLAQRGFSQILKREEAMRKSVERHKPPLLHELLPALEEWADAHDGAGFALDGVDVAELMEEERAKLERRTRRTSLPRKRSGSSGSQAASASAPVAKRIKPAQATPSLRSNRVPPSRPPPTTSTNRAAPNRPNGSATTRPVSNRSAPNRPATARPVANRPAPTRPAPNPRRPVHGAGRPDQARPQPSRPAANAGTVANAAGQASAAATERQIIYPRSNAPLKPDGGEAVRRAAAIRAASRAIELSCTRPPLLQASPRATRTAPRAVQPLAPRPAMRTARQPTTLPATRRAPRPAVRSTPRVVAQPQLSKASRPGNVPQPVARSTDIHGHGAPNPSPRAPLAELPAANVPKRDWRAQRKADLEQNGLSYYDDSTAEIPTQTREQSFDFKHFF